MKQFLLLLFPLFSLGSKATAQLSEHFDPVNAGSPLPSLSASCWQFTNAEWTDQNYMNNNGCLYALPNQGGLLQASVQSPYLNFTGNPVTISFQYKVSSRLTGANRTIRIGLINNQDAFTEIANIRLNEFTTTGILRYLNTFNNIPAGGQRLALELTGSQDVRTYVFLDDISIDVNKIYASGCNSTPQTDNDVYTANTQGMYQGSSVLTNDTEPDGETMVPTVVSSPDGTVTFNADGSFQFVPNSNFTGNSATFTYSVTDNGSKPLASVASVTIHFPSYITLPVKLLSFTGALVDNQVTLRWSVAENETGNYFEVQKSMDGSTYKATGTIGITSKKGIENYTLRDAAVFTGDAYYRLKVVNSNGAITYSKAILVKGIKATKLSSLTIRKYDAGALHFTFSAAAGGTYQVAVASINGTTLLSRKITLEKGLNTVTINLNPAAASGIHLLEVSNSTDSSCVKFMK